eukprot:3864821-Amphidinium_carterae.1
MAWVLVPSSRGSELEQPAWDMALKAPSDTGLEGVKLGLKQMGTAIVSRQFELTDDDSMAPLYQSIAAQIALIGA